jgi:VanZ family protein
MLVVLSGLSVALQLFGLYRPVGPGQVAWIPYGDKVAHLVGFAVPVALILITLSWYATRRGAVLTKLAIIAVAGLFAVHGVVSEIIQGNWYSDRSGDLVDVIADWLGVAMGVAAYAALRPAVTSRAGGES